MKPSNVSSSQPIVEIGAQLSVTNAQRLKDGLFPVIFHTDAAQTVGKVPVDVRELNVDLMTIVGHKVGN